MAISIYTISLFVHIIAVIFWMFTIPIHMIIDRAIGKLDDVSKQFRMMKIVTINGKISIGSALIVFLTGALMIQFSSYNWSPDEGTVWLVVKQTIWLILLIVIILLNKPLSDKLINMIDNDGEEGLIFDLYKKLKIRGHILTTLIVINIFLAVTKPF